MNARALFDGDNVVGCAPVFKKIPQRETKILIEQPRDAGAAQIRIDEDNVFAGQRCRPRKGESMGGFPLAAGRGSYAEGGARPSCRLTEADLGPATAS